MSFILDALKRSARDKQFSTVDIDPKPWHWDGWPSVRQHDGTLRERIRTSVLPYVKMITIGVLALTLSSAVTWASMAYLNNSDSAASENETLQAARNYVYGGIRNSTTAGNDVSPALPVSMSGPGAFLSDGMDQTEEEPVGMVREEESTETTGVDYRAALLEEDATSATPAIDLPMEDEFASNDDLDAADGIYLDGVSYHSMSIKRRAILRRAGESEGDVVKVGDMYAGLEVAAIHDSNVSLKKGINRFVIHLD
ncbi:MAG: hypothetical protein ACE5EN_03655 [Nitrospinota bacterium]